MKRRGRPARIKPQHAVMVAAAVEKWLRWKWPLRAKGHTSRLDACRHVAEELEGLIGPEMVAKLYKRHAAQVKRLQMLDLWKLSSYLHQRYVGERVDDEVFQHVDPWADNPRSRRAQADISKFMPRIRRG